MSMKRYNFPMKYIDDFPFPHYLILKNVRETINWKPDAGDVIVATYPKSGTTWLQAIVWMIQHNGEGSLPRFKDMNYKLFPYMESIEIEAVKALTSPRHLKTHLPFNLTPMNEKAKYITVARNPKDVCVSYYYFSEEMAQISNIPYCTLDQFFEEFIEGKVPYGDYIDHMLTWYKHKDDENVLFLVYEEIKKNHREAVMKIAKFLSSTEIDYAKMLENDPNLWKTIVEKTTFEAMKSMLVNDPLELTDPKKVRSCGKLVKFFRKGIAGDWVNHFNSEQINRFDTLMQRKLGNIIQEFGWN